MINVSILENNAKYRKGLHKLFDISEDFCVVFCDDEIEHGLSLLSDQIDVLLIDLELITCLKNDTLLNIKSRLPNIKILLLTYEDNDDIFNSLLNGADGYLLKQLPASQILISIKECMNGGSPMTSLVAGRILELFKKTHPIKTNKFHLTKREVEILQLLVDGFNNQSIADELFISIQTVRNHIRHIYEKLHVHSKSQAVVKAIREGLI